MRKSFVSAVLLVGLSGAAIAGTVPWIEPNPVPVPAGSTPAQVAAAIRRALEDQDWVVVDEAVGRTEATLEARGRRARIRAEYDGARVRFVHVPGEKLRQEQRDGRLHVDKVYQGWANDLVEVLASEFAPGQDDVLPPMIAAEPPTTSTARPVIRVASRGERSQGYAAFGNNPVAELYVIRDASGRDLLEGNDRRTLFGRSRAPASTPTVVDAGTYGLLVGCVMSTYPMHMRKDVEVVLETRAGLEYIIECVGRTGPNIRPQIQPRALP